MVQNITDCIGRWIYWIRREQEIYATEFNLHLWRGWPSRCCGNLRPQRINKQLFIILTVVARQPDDPVKKKKNNSPAWGMSCEENLVRSMFRRFLLKGDIRKRRCLLTCCFVVITLMGIDDMIGRHDLWLIYMKVCFELTSISILSIWERWNKKIW